MVKRTCVTAAAVSNYTMSTLALNFTLILIFNFFISNFYVYIDAMVCGVLSAAAVSTTYPLIIERKKKILAPISTSLYLIYLINYITFITIQAYTILG